MKKKLALMMAVTLTMGSLLTGCGSSNDAAQTTTDTEAAAEETTDDAATEETQD